MKNDLPPVLLDSATLRKSLAVLGAESNVECAELLGVSRGTLHRLEADQMPVGPSTLAGLYALFGKRCGDYLVTPTEEKPAPSRTGLVRRPR